VRTQSICLALGLFFSMAGLSCSASIGTQADRILQPFKLSDGPGGAVMVVRQDSVVFAEAFGKSEVETGAVNTLTTNFRLASVTKQFTAMAVMMLAERGKMSLDQHLSDFFPEFAPVGRRITVKHLLTHTSGLVAYEDVMPESTTVPLLDEDVLRLLKNIDSTGTVPGSAFVYSNSGFSLLALIVERVSGMSFARFLKENIFLPAGMNNTVAYERGISEVVQRAYGYSADTIHPGRFERTDQSLTSSVLGDGGVYSSVEDMRKWARALARGTLVSAKTMTAILSRNVTVEEGKTWYGYGWMIKSMDGVPVYFHSGSTVGFRTMILRIPERSLTVIALFNRSDMRAEEIGWDLAELYLSAP
jgi:CubicO group peptidase (beta-lactamase class C family)